MIRLTVVVTVPVGTPVPVALDYGAPTITVGGDPEVAHLTGQDFEDVAFSNIVTSNANDNGRPAVWPGMAVEIDGSNLGGISKISHTPYAPLMEVQLQGCSGTHFVQAYQVDPGGTWAIFLFPGDPYNAESPNSLVANMPDPGVQLSVITPGGQAYYNQFVYVAPMASVAMNVTVTNPAGDPTTTSLALTGARTVTWGPASGESGTFDPGAVLGQPLDRRVHGLGPTGTDAYFSGVQVNPGWTVELYQFSGVGLSDPTHFPTYVRPHFSGGSATSGNLATTVEWSPMNPNSYAGPLPQRLQGMPLEYGFQLQLMGMWGTPPTNTLGPAKGYGC